jgi:hypothetical protein
VPWNGFSLTSAAGRRSAAGRKETWVVRTETGILLWTAALVTSCTVHHPLDAEWKNLTVEAREARAIEAVRLALAKRGARIPDRPGTEENEVLFIDRRLAVYRTCRQQSARDVSRRNLAVLLFRDIRRLERRVVYDFPSQPEDLSIYLRRGSPSVWGVGAHESLLSPLLSRVDLEDPALLLPQRPRGAYRRLEAALGYLLSLPLPLEGPGQAVARSLRRADREELHRARFEMEVLEHISDFRR